MARSLYTHLIYIYILHLYIYEYVCDGNFTDRLGFVTLPCIHSAPCTEHPFCPRQHGVAKVMKSSKASLTQGALFISALPVPVYQDSANTGKRVVLERTCCG